MNEILKVDSLIKGFGRKNVLRSLSLSLKKGEVCGLLGRNGAGKTTLIRILMGIIPADGGRVVYQGRPVSYESAGYKRTVGYVAEDSIFFSWMRVGKLLRFNSTFFPSWSMTRAEAYLNRLSLNKKDRIQTLSRGQKLKLSLVVALAAAPELLLLDDPTSGLDVPSRQDFLKDIIREIVDAGTTVLFASHLVHELEKIIDRVAILHDGLIIVDEGFEEIKSQTRRVVLVGRPEDLEIIGIEGILTKDITGNRCELVVFPWDDKKQKSLAAASRAPLEITALSLEEIFTSFVS